MGTDFETLQRGATVIYGACGGIWVMTVFAKPGAADMHLARAALKTMQQRHRDGFPTLTWVLPEAGYSMDADARAAATQVTQEFNPAITAMATLIEGQGFQAAAVRAIVSGMDFVARAKAPKKVFAELSPSVSWCGAMRPPRDRHAGDVAEITAALATMRKGLVSGHRAVG